jgi:hypothetical protein
MSAGESVRDISGERYVNEEHVHGCREGEGLRCRI